MANPKIKIARFDSSNGIPTYQLMPGELALDTKNKNECLLIGNGSNIRWEDAGKTPHILINDTQYRGDIVIQQEYYNGTLSGYEGYRSGYRVWKSGFQEEWGTIKREAAISKSTTVTLEVSCILDYNTDYMMPHIIIGGVGAVDTVISSKGASDPVSALGTTKFNYRMRNMSTGTATPKNIYGYYYMCGYGYTGTDVPQPDFGGDDE